MRSDDLSKGPRPQHFVPYRQRPDRAFFGVLVIRSKILPTAIGPTARAAIRALDPNVRLISIDPEAALVERAAKEMNGRLVLARAVQRPDCVAPDQIRNYRQDFRSA